MYNGNQDNDFDKLCLAEFLLIVFLCFYVQVFNKSVLQIPQKLFKIFQNNYHKIYYQHSKKYWRVKLLVFENASLLKMNILMYLLRKWLQFHENIFYWAVSVAPSLANFKIYKAPLVSGALQKWSFYKNLFCMMPIFLLHPAILLKDQHEFFSTISTSLAGNFFAKIFSVGDS